MRFTWELQKANGRKSSVGCFFLSFCLSFFFFFFFFLFFFFFSFFFFFLKPVSKLSFLEDDPR